MLFLWAGSSSYYYNKINGKAYVDLGVPGRLLISNSYIGLCGAAVGAVVKRQADNHVSLVFFPVNHFSFYAIDICVGGSLLTTKMSFLLSFIYGLYWISRVTQFCLSHLGGTLQWFNLKWKRDVFILGKTMAKWWE